MRPSSLIPITTLIFACSVLTALATASIKFEALNSSLTLNDAYPPWYEVLNTVDLSMRVLPTEGADDSAMTLVTEFAKDLGRHASGTLTRREHKSDDKYQIQLEPNNESRHTGLNYAEASQVVDMLHYIFEHSEWVILMGPQICTFTVARGKERTQDVVATGSLKTWDQIDEVY